MSGTPTVSVVIPTYNRAELVGQAIDSVLAQTFEDFEIVVVDDGSTDDTQMRVQMCSDPRLRYVWTENGGAGHARNVGMRQARGRFLTFLDSDDLYYPYTLALGSRMLERFPDIGLVCTEMSGFDGRGMFERYHLKTYHDSAYRDPAVTYDRIFESSVCLGGLDVLPADLVRDDASMLERRAYFGNIFDTYLVNLVLFHNSVMLRSEVLAGIGERNERLRYFEDMDFILRICRHHRVGFVDVPTYKLRYHDGQISTTARADGKYVWIRKQQALLRVVKRQAMEDRDYYKDHRSRIDTHLAHLHRAVAVPLMLFPGPASKCRRYAKVARKYLLRCRRYGRSFNLLLAISFAPGPLRRAAVTLVERGRGMVSDFSGRLARGGAAPPLARARG